MSQDRITTQSTSKNHAIADDIVLRVSENARLLFRPELVDNENDPAACVRGTFIYQRKGIKEKWNDYRTLNLSNLKKGEWIRLEIKSGELKNLISSLDVHYKIFEKYGIQAGNVDYVPTTLDVVPIIETLNREPELRKSVIEKGGKSIFIEVLKWLSEFESVEEISSELQKLDPTHIGKIQSLIGIARLKNMLKQWFDNKNKCDEEFWQKLLQKNSWLISQLFATPLVIFSDKAYMGGKGIDNQNGQIADFIFKNQLTDNIAIIELKTPCTELLSSEYRSSIYPPSKELSGGVIQVLAQKQNILNNYHSLNHNSDAKFIALNPNCVLIVGSLENSKMNNEQIKSFESFRNNIDGINIVTFDELFNKIEMLINILEGN